MRFSITKDRSTTGPLQVHGLTDQGSVRPHNEDYFGYCIPPDPYAKDKWGNLFAVSDGVGGSSAGEVASAEAVNVLLQEYYFGAHSDKVPDRLKSAFQKAAMHVFDLSMSQESVRNMKCTLSALVLRQNRFFITHVGDSKIFLLRGNKITQLTKDHSLVGKLMRLGLLTAEEARKHPNKNVLLKAVGDGPLLMPDFYAGNSERGDLFCLVSDGILEHASAEELKLFLLEKGYEDRHLSELVNELNQRGGFDNMTIVTVKVKEIP